MTAIITNPKLNSKSDLCDATTVLNRSPNWPEISDNYSRCNKTTIGEQHHCDTLTTITGRKRRKRKRKRKTTHLKSEEKFNLLNKSTYIKSFCKLSSSSSTKNLIILSCIAAYCILIQTSYIVECSLVINIAPSITDAHSDASPKSSRINTRQTSEHHHHHHQLIKRSTGEITSAKLKEIDALHYLQRYGYMNGSLSSSDNLITEDSFHDAVMSFQRFAGIPETGSVDPMTLKYMQMPRCGNKDRSGKGENGRKRRRRRRKRRKKRYALQGSKWRRQELTYRISQYPTRFLSKKYEVDGQIEKAFRIWSQVAPIDFVVRKEGRVHIDIRFASGEHGDGDPFDGPGNTLAHAYFPQYGGDAHFDDQEYWTVDSYTGTNIFQVAAHELGHSLGLGHSSVREALMAPFYQKYKPNFKLHPDDILGIQALYGEKSDTDNNNNNDDNDNDDAPSSTGSSTSTTTTTTTTTSTETPRRRTFFGADDDSPRPSKAVDLCQDATIDAITRTEDGNTYVFRGQYYWQVKNEGLANGGVGLKISRDWDGLPGDLDAALTWADGKTFFFKGDRYWRFQNKRREPGYPKQISAGFAGIPNNVDAAFVWGGNGKTYFFKRDKYWRYDSKQEPPVSGLYPKSIKNWSGLPLSGIQAAFQWENGMTYFFKDDLYYRFDDREFEIDKLAKPSFPRSTAEWWFGCTNSNLPLKAKPDISSDLDSNQSTSMFHRKPNLLYSSASPQHNHISSRSASASASASTSTSAESAHSQSELSSSTTTKPFSAVNPISSFLSSLGSLWSSSSSNSNSISSNNNARSSSNADSDWSFHRGIGEEVHKLLRSSDTSMNKWNFPISGSSSNGGSSNSNRGSGEQSRSELRMDPPNNSNSSRR